MEFNSGFKGLNKAVKYRNNQSVHFWNPENITRCQV